MVSHSGVLWSSCGRMPEMHTACICLARALSLTHTRTLCYLHAPHSSNDDTAAVCPTTFPSA